MAELPIHVAFVLTSFGRGGMEMRLVDVVNRIDAARYDPHVYTLYDRQTMRDKIPPARLHMAYSSGKYDLLPAYKLASAFRIHDTKIVWSMAQGLSAAWGRLGAVLAGVPIKILSIHDNAPLYPLTRALMPFTDVVVTNSQLSADTLLQQGIDPQKVKVLYNGIDTERFRPADDQRQTLYNIPADRPVILNVGRLFPEKGRDVMLRATVPLMGNDPAPLVVFAGEGEGSQRAELEQLAQDLGIAQNVRFLGIRDDIPVLMQSADVLVMSSRDVPFGESCPNVVLEAMATQIPVIGTRVGGTAELLIDGETGLLIPPDDVTALTQALMQLLSNPAQRYQMGQEGRQRVVEHFSIEAMIAGREVLFAEVLNRKGLTP